MTLGNSVTTIGLAAFQNNSLTNVTIPSSVTGIAARAFDMDTLESVTFEGNAPTITAAGTTGAFGPADGKTLRYYSTATGFTTPTWRDYATEEIPVQHAVTFNTNGGNTITPVGIDHGETLTAPTAPTRTGHTFTGWFTDADLTTTHDFDDPITSDLTLYAGWDINNYTVTFNTGDGSTVAPASIDHGETLTAPTAPTRAGHAFTGWFTDAGLSTAHDFDDAVIGNITLYAGWSINGYTVSFDTVGGTAVAPESIDHGELVTPPTAPTRFGYTFTGWYSDPGATYTFDFDEPITESVTAYAGWVLNSYSITIDLGDGSPATNITLNHGDTIPRPADPVREGHTFTGWYISPATGTAASFNPAVAFAPASFADGVLYDFDTPVTGPITLYAGWSLNSYTVSFDTGDGSAVDPITVNYGDTFPIPADPTRAGYTFTGWYTDPETTTAYDPDAPVTGELTLYAGWEAVAAPTAPEKPEQTKALSTTGTTEPSDLLGVGVLTAIAGLLVLVGRRRLRAGS